MKNIIMAFGVLAIAGAVPAFAQDATTPPPAPPAPDATMAPPAAPTPPAADGSMAPAQPGSMSSGSSSSGAMSSGGMQSSMPSATTGPLPKCSARIKDRCDQSATSERYALSADQAMKTGGVGDRRSDNAAMSKPMMGKHSMHHHRMMHKPAAAAAPAPAAM